MNCRCVPVVMFHFRDGSSVYIFSYFPNAKGYLNYGHIISYLFKYNRSLHRTRKTKNVEKQNMTVINEACIKFFSVWVGSYICVH